MIESIDLGISGIYCIENMINGNKYIGSSKDIKRRWHEHQSELRRQDHHNDYFQKAYNKYGIENFFFYIVEECLEEELSDKERYYIQFYNTRNHKGGYNLSDGGDKGARNLIVSDETKRKISEAAKGRRHTQEHKDKMSIVMTENKIGKKKNGSNPHVGVYLINKKNNKSNFWAHICYKGKQYHLGHFKFLEDAISAYKQAFYELTGKIFDNESEG